MALTAWTPRGPLHRQTSVVVLQRCEVRLWSHCLIGCGMVVARSRLFKIVAPVPEAGLGPAISSLGGRRLIGPTGADRTLSRSVPWAVARRRE